MERSRTPKSPFALAIRPILFASTVEGETYLSTDGGAITLGVFQERVIGITCQHVFKGHHESKLYVSESLRGDTLRRPNYFVSLQGITEETAGSELEDLVVCAWDDPQPNFPPDELVNFDNAVDSEDSDDIVAVGFLKDETDVSVELAKTFCLELHMVDLGQFGHDQFLRIAAGQPIRTHNGPKWRPSL